MYRANEGGTSSFATSLSHDKKIIRDSYDHRRCRPRRTSMNGCTTKRCSENIARDNDGDAFTEIAN